MIDQNSETVKQLSLFDVSDYDNRVFESHFSCKIVLGDKVSVFDRCYCREVQNHEDDDFVRFPAQFWQYFKNLLKLWLYARYFDKIGEGRAQFSIAKAAKFFNRRPSTIRRWLKLCYQRGLCRGLVYEDDYVIFYYTSIHRVAESLDLDSLRPVGLVNFADEKQRQNLGIVAVEIIQNDLQKASRFAAEEERKRQLAEIKNLRQECDRERQSKIEELRKLYQGKPIPKKEFEKHCLVKKLPSVLGKTLTPREILTCGKTMARVLWINKLAIGVTENFNAYGVSQEIIARISGLSVRQIQRYYSDIYRVEQSPIKKYRGYHPVGFTQDNIPKSDIFKKYGLGKKQIYQRLPYRVKFSHISIFDEVEGNRGCKYYEDDYGRIWERKCNIIMPSHQLVRMKFRQSYLYLTR